MKFILRFLGWCSLGWAILKLLWDKYEEETLSNGPATDHDYLYIVIFLLISIAFFTSALYEGSFRLTKEPKLKTIKRN